MEVILSLSYARIGGGSRGTAEPEVGMWGPSHGYSNIQDLFHYLFNVVFCGKNNKMVKSCVCKIELGSFPDKQHMPCKHALFPLPSFSTLHLSSSCITPTLPTVRGRKRYFSPISVLLFWLQLLCLSARSSI